MKVRGFKICTKFTNSLILPNLFNFVVNILISGLGLLIVEISKISQTFFFMLLSVFSSRATQLNHSFGINTTKLSLQRTKIRML